MPLSTEVFVMVIFIAGCPFFFFILWDADFRGRSFFMSAYSLLTLSNICTVLEEFWLNAFFNFCEHFFITMASGMMLVAVLKLTEKRQRTNAVRKSDRLEA